MAIKNQSKVRDSTVVRTTRATRSADRSPYARRVTKGGVELDNGSRSQSSRRHETRVMNEGPVATTPSENASSSQQRETMFARDATGSNSTLSQTLVAVSEETQTSTSNDTAHSRAATLKSEEAHDSDDDEDHVEYFIAPVDLFPSPPPDEYSPTPEPYIQPFDPVKTPTPPPGLRAQIEAAPPDPQRLATPDDDSPPRSTPPLYSPRYPPSPTLLDRHPQTWLDEIMVSLERRHGNLVSELKDAETDVKDALMESYKALVAVKELVGPQGLDGVEAALEKEGGRRSGKGDTQVISFMRTIQAMVGSEIVKKMLKDARDTAAGDDFEEDEKNEEGDADEGNADDDATSQRAEEIGTPMELTVDVEAL